MKKRLIFVLVGMIIMIMYMKVISQSENANKDIMYNIEENEVQVVPVVQRVPVDMEEVCMPSVMKYQMGIQTKAITEGAMLEFNQQWSNMEFAADDLLYDYYYSCLEEDAVQVLGMFYDSYDVLEVVDEKRDISVLLDVIDFDMPEYGFRPTFYFDWIGKVNMEKDNPDIIRDAFRKNESIRQEITTQMNYIHKNLTEIDYAGVNYDVEKKQLIVYLVNQELREMLENIGVVCESVEYSYAQLYERMHEIWDTRQELGIVEINVSEESNTLCIYGILPKKEFNEKVKAYAWSELPYIYADLHYPVSNNNVTGLIDADDIDEFIYILKAKNFGDDDAYYNKLKTALTYMKQCYPDYTLLQLYYHVSVDCEYQNYMNFDDELEEFVSSLPAYKKDMDFISELSYGDPLRLGLKQVLRQAKLLHPEKSYQELYEMYPELSVLVETSEYSKSESMHRYMYLKAMQKKELFPQKEKYEKDIPEEDIPEDKHIFLWCVISMFVGIIVLIHSERKNGSLY